MSDGSMERAAAQVRESYGTPEAVARYRARASAGLRKWEAAVVRQYFPPTGEVLVVGCGAGREAFALAQMGYRVMGADVSAPLVAAARELAAARQCAARFALVDGASLPAAEGGYDAVTLWSQVLGNVPGAARRLALLRETRRVLRPGGLLSLSAHDRGRTLPRVEAASIVSRGDPEPGDLCLCEEAEGTSRYWHYFDAAELRNLCAAAGYGRTEVVHTSDLGETWDNVLVAVGRG
ncbi:MAG: class I SAM-dependent methyltransferase [Gemmatimonadota bacterium]